jgi:hypothetical protein
MTQEPQISPDGSEDQLVTRFQAYVADLRHGSETMVARLNTVLSSQSFLAIAYATSMASANRHWHDTFAVTIPPVMAALGFVLAFAGYLDIRAAKTEVAHWHREAARLLADYPHLRSRLQRGGEVRHDTPRSAGELMANRAPLAFMTGWTWFFLAPWILRSL